MKYSLLSLFATLNICVYGQTTEERGKIVSNYDLNYLDSLRVASETKFWLNKAKAIDFAREKLIPERFIDEKGNYNELMYIENSFPFYYTTHNAGSAITARVNRINSGGSAGLNLNGQGMILGIWDGGPVRGSHQDLQGRVTFKDGENRRIEYEPSVFYQYFASDQRSTTDFNFKYRRYNRYEDYYWVGVSYRFLNDQFPKPLSLGPMAGFMKSKIQLRKAFRFCRFLRRCPSSQIRKNQLDLCILIN